MFKKVNVTLFTVLIFFLYSNIFACTVTCKNNQNNQKTTIASCHSSIDSTQQVQDKKECLCDISTIVPSYTKAIVLTFVKPYSIVIQYSFNHTIKLTQKSKLYFFKTPPLYHTKLII